MIGNPTPLTVINTTLSLSLSHTDFTEWAAWIVVVAEYIYISDCPALALDRREMTGMRVLPRRYKFAVACVLVLLWTLSGQNLHHHHILGFRSASSGILLHNDTSASPPFCIILSLST